MKAKQGNKIINLLTEFEVNTMIKIALNKRMHEFNRELDGLRKRLAELEL
jgi:hypothetical protein